MYERDVRPRPLASADLFRRRLARGGQLAFALVAGSLAFGMAGYSFFEGLSFVDSFLDAAMILSGMGPVHTPQSTLGKLFAGFYAIYSGFAVLIIAAILIAPIAHRLFHRFHIEESGDDQDKPAKKK